MDGETELEMVRRHVRRGAELVDQQRQLVRSLPPDHPQRDRAAGLLDQLEIALALHLEHLALLLRDSN